MTQWSNVDSNTTGPIWAAAQFKKAPNQANLDSIFNGTNEDAFLDNMNVGLFAVTTGEQAATANTGHGAHAGWVLRTVGTGNRAGRVQYETLVAHGSIIEDTEDTVFVDYQIVISVQPADSEETEGNAISFSTTVVTRPTGGTLTYYWQNDGGAGSWANVANTGVYASASGVTSADLQISDTSDLQDNVYRVVISVAGGDNLNSANATLTHL